MAKIKDYMAGREDGLQLAFSIVKERGIEGMEEEIKFRNVTGIHTMLAKKDLDKATRKIKEMTIANDVPKSTERGQMLKNMMSSKREV